MGFRAMSVVFRLSEFDLPEWICSSSQRRHGIHDVIQTPFAQIHRHQLQIHLPEIVLAFPAPLAESVH